MPEQGRKRVLTGILRLLETDGKEGRSMRPKAPKHGRIKEKYNPTPNAAQKRFHDYVRDIGCLVCKRAPSIHHIISNGNQRISKSHWHVTPLCPEHHQGLLGYHGLGSHDLFYEMYGINLYDVGLQILEDYSL